MERSDEADARAFWDLMKRTTGSRSSSWDTFSATFETYMRRHFADEMSQLPSVTRAEAEMVLRYAFDRGNPARAAAGTHVTPMHLSQFLGRFGPMRSCLLKAARSLFDKSGCLVPWFHGQTSREEAICAIEEWEATRREGRQQRGVFLFRYSDRRQPKISFSYRRRKGDKRLINCLIDNGPRGYSLDEKPDVWRDLQEFVQEMRVDFVHPVQSALYLECQEEIDWRLREQQFSPPPGDKLSYARQIYAEAQAEAIRPLGASVEATRVLEKALGMVRQVEFILGQLEEGDPQLQVKALRLGGDILWKLHREEEGVASFLRCLNVVSEAEDAGSEDSPVVTASVLRHVHQLLAEYFLHQGSPGRGLDHFSELMACTTDEHARRQLLNESRRTDDYHRATAGLTPSTVQAMLDEGISYFRDHDYGPAGEKFEKVLRHARCIGEGKLEARALGNLATVDYKTQRIPAAIRRYKTCVQLLRQQGDQVTERKILNYLVMCCIEAKRWAPAKLFHEQLSKLAESEQNIRHLGRLKGLIEDGMALQAAQLAEAAPSGGGEGSGLVGTAATTATATVARGSAAPAATGGGSSSFFPSQGAAPSGDPYHLYGPLRQDTAPASSSEGDSRGGQLRGAASTTGATGLRRVDVQRRQYASPARAGGDVDDYVLVSPDPPPPPPPPPQPHYGPYSNR